MGLHDITVNNHLYGLTTYGAGMQSVKSDYIVSLYINRLFNLSLTS